MVFGLIFEVPLAITLHAKLGWVDAPFLKRYRKWAFLGAFIVAAILTPTPDPFNQCLMALPCIFFMRWGSSARGFQQETAPAEALCPPWRRLGPTVMANRAMSGAGGGDNEYLGVPTGRRGQLRGVGDDETSSSFHRLSIYA